MHITLEPYFSRGTNTNISNRGASVPPWYNRENQISTWYSSRPIDYFYNLVQNSEKDYTLFIQYGQNNNEWASARFLAQNIKVIDETLKKDNSIDVTVQITSLFLKGVKNNVASAGWLVNTNVSINGVSQYNYEGNTYANYSYGSRTPITITVNVKPGGRNTKSAFHWYNNYPNGDSPTIQMYMGVALLNTYEPVYVPMAIRQYGNWNSLNETDKKIQIRQGNWKDVEKEKHETIKQLNTGHNRIRQSGNWLQLPPM